MNFYLPQIVLSGRVKRIDIWHGSNLAESQYALDYWEGYGALWRGQGEAVRFLRLVYENEAVSSELNRFIEVATELRKEHDVRARGPLVDEEMELASTERIKRTNPEIASQVLGRYRPL